MGSVPPRMRVQKAKMEALRGKTALITGASSGLGVDFARYLAACGCALVLVARRAERLRELQAELSTRYQVSGETVALDLAEPDAPQRLYDQLNRAGCTIDVLINNAGHGLFGEFTTTPWESLHQMMELDMVALTQLTHLFSADMVRRKDGYILLVASTGAFQPTPTYAVYAAAKSYVLMLGEALHYELRRTGVQCTVLCPGPTRTEFFNVANQQLTAYQRMTMMESATVARIGLEALLRGRSSVVAGRFNALFALATRLAPRQMLAGMAAMVMHEES